MKTHLQGNRSKDKANFFTKKKGQAVFFCKLNALLVITVCENLWNKVKGQHKSTTAVADCGTVPVRVIP